MTKDLVFLNIMGNYKVQTFIMMGSFHATLLPLRHPPASIHRECTFLTYEKAVVVRNVTHFESIASNSLDEDFCTKTCNTRMEHIIEYTGTKAEKN